MSSDKILSTLSLAQKAGQVASGELAVEQAVKGKRACLVIVACDASDNTKKKMRNMAATYQVPLYYYSVKEGLGKAIGKEYRSAVAVTHQELADSLKEQLRTTSQRNREDKHGKNESL